MNIQPIQYDNTVPNLLSPQDSETSSIKVHDHFKHIITLVKKSLATAFCWTSAICCTSYTFQGQTLNKECLGCLGCICMTVCGCTFCCDFLPYVFNDNENKKALIDQTHIEYSSIAKGEIKPGWDEFQKNHVFSSRSIKNSIEARQANNEYQATLHNHMMTERQRNNDELNRQSFYHRQQ